MPLYINTEMIEAANAGEDMPETLTDPTTGEPAFTAVWTSTDGWRGFYDSTPTNGSGWKKVDDGWVTGDWPDAPAEARESNVKAKLDALAETQDVLVIFMPTSNVFSTGYDVYVREPAVTTDRYGNEWPGDYVVCPDCGQPDNSGDCTHEPLSPDEVEALGGRRA